MIIVVEGPDGSGKTTLATKLADAFGYGMVHFSAPKTKAEQDNLFITYFRYLLTHNNVVIDRCWPSAVIYGKIMRGSVDITDEQIKHIEDVFGRKIIMIYCTGDPRVMWQRCQERGEEYIKDEHTYLKICKEYEIFMALHRFRIPVYTWTLGVTNDK